MIKKVIIGIIGLFIILAVLALRPVPIIAEDEAIAETGIVSTIFEGGENDVIFKLSNSERLFYINRGLEQNLSLEDLRYELIGKEVVFKYPDYWTPLDWNKRVRHLSKVEVGEEVIYSELLPSKSK